MERVAENQDREQKARTQFVYEETVHRVMRRKDLLCHAWPKGTERKLEPVKAGTA